MPATSAASLALAGRLRELDDDALARLIRDRAVAPAAVRDVFDLADALLEPSSIERALAGMPRHSLAVLASAAEHLEGIALDELAATLGVPLERLDLLLPPLVDAALALVVASDSRSTVTVPPAVADELASWPAKGLPSARELREARAPELTAARAPTDPAAVDRTAAERAFGTTTAVGELAQSLEREPGRTLARGGISLPDAKRLAAAAGVELDTVPALLDLATRAGLVEVDAGGVRASTAVDGWRRTTPPHRWGVLAAAWHASLPAELAAELARLSASPSMSTARLGDVVFWLYPAGGEALRERLRERVDRAERLGLAVGGELGTLGRALLAAEGDARAAVAALEPLIPAEVRQVYLQHDLTVVSPGPLAGELDARLRRLAEVESAGLAGRYRITAESVTRAVALGETAQSLHAFLESISLTGVPQPLAYLINETAERYGALRVGPLSRDEHADLGASTSVRSDDRALIDAVTVDAALASLSLRRVGDHRVVSRFAPDVVLWTLIDARYPAAPENGLATPARPGSQRAAAAQPHDDGVTAAVARLRRSVTDVEPGDDAWVARQWQLALRSKLSVRATVLMPDGSERVFELEPTGIGAGRVRGRDLAVDVERTLPVSSITAVEPLA